jgi:hypothetical protein
VVKCQCQAVLTISLLQGRAMLNLAERISQASDNDVALESFGGRRDRRKQCKLAKKTRQTVTQSALGVSNLCKAEENCA